MDNNERLTYLNSRNTNMLINKVIETTIDSYIAKKSATNKRISQELLDERIRAIKNALFLKYAGIEYEGGSFFGYFEDRKLG